MKNIQILAAFQECVQVRVNILKSVLIFAVLFAYAGGVLASQPGNIAQEVLLLPSTYMEVNPSTVDPRSSEEVEYEAGVDIVYSLNYNHFRLLGELIATNEEFETERLQFGLNLLPNTMLWLGRVFAPIGFWNTEYHHGAFYQGTIHRPGIAEYEDEGGIMPTHITGALLEGRSVLDGQVFDLAASVGLAPVLYDSLEAFGQGHGEQSEHGLTATIRLDHRFDEFNASHQGLFYNRTRINAEEQQLIYVDQWTAGGYFHQAWLETHITAAAFYVHSTLNYGATSEKTSFTSGYVNLEHEFTDKWVAYTRAEYSYKADEDAYLALFPKFVTESYMVGLRVDFLRRNAINVEAATVSRGEESFLRYSIQWSLAIP